MHTLYYNIDQLTRLYDHIDRGHPIKIMHIVTEDFERASDDRYIVLLDCDPATYTLLLML